MIQKHLQAHQSPRKIFNWYQEISMKLTFFGLKKSPSATLSLLIPRSLFLFKLNVSVSGKNSSLIPLATLGIFSVPLKCFLNLIAFTATYKSCTYAPTDAENEHVAETIHKLIPDLLNAVQLVKTTLSHFSCTE